MKCFDINEIFEIIEKRDERIKELEEHIKACEECKINYQKIREFIETVQIEVPFDAKVKIKNRIFEKVKKKEKFRFILVPSLLTALAVILFVFIFVKEKNKEDIVIFSPGKQAVLTPEEVLFAFKMRKLRNYRVYIDDIDITDSLKNEGNVFYFLAENLELDPGPHVLTIIEDESRIISREFYLTSFKYSAGY